MIGPGDAIVVIYRGIERESYSCAPVCEKRITLGDSAPIYGANLTALGSFLADEPRAEEIAGLHHVRVVSGA